MKRLFFLLFVTIMSQSTFYLYADENEKEVETPIPKKMALWSKRIAMTLGAD